MDEQFIKSEYRNLVMVDDDPEKLLEKFALYRGQQIDKLVDLSNT